nr:MAG TPA: hypothetical protein [Caudoviricetes sp.]
MSRQNLCVCRLFADKSLFYADNMQTNCCCIL